MCVCVCVCVLCFQIALWVRYTLTAALDQILDDFGHGKQGTSMAPSAEHVSIGASAANSLSCPVMGKKDAGSQATQQLPRVTPEQYAAMDADERSAIVHRHMPPALMDFVETALHVRVWGEKACGVFMNLLGYPVPPLPPRVN